MGHLDSVQIRIGDLPKDALNHSMAPGLKENRKIYFESPSDVYVLSFMPGRPVESRFLKYLTLVQISTTTVLCKTSHVFPHPVRFRSPSLARVGFSPPCRPCFSSRFAFVTWQITTTVFTGYRLSANDTNLVCV